jgi:hypothetical protein
MQPPASGTAGPDVTEALRATLKKVDSDWGSAPDKQKCACFNLYKIQAGRNGWDIFMLKKLGFGEDFLEKRGTGDWERTVQFSYRSAGQRKVYWAGAVNYALWGRMNYLCWSKFGPGFGGRGPGNLWSLGHALNTVTLWKWAKYFGDKVEDARAFTKYGYMNENPETVALPTDERLTADPKNVTTMAVLPYGWRGLNYDFSSADER